MQYQPSEASQESFTLHLDVISQEQARQRLASDPELLKKLRVTTVEEGVWSLQQQVHLRITEYFDYVIDDPRAAVKLRIVEGD